jgi:hypothetical protein
MKTRYLVAISLLTMPLVALADNVVFNDIFTSQSDTYNVAPTAPTSTYTTWQPLSAKNISDPSGISNGFFRFTFSTATSSGFGEMQAQFTTSPVTLTSVGDFVKLLVVFTNTTGTLLAGGTGSYLWDGLYNSYGVGPTNGLGNGGLNSNPGSPYATGGAQLWKGFIGKMATNNNVIYARPPQNGAGTASGNQDVVGNNTSSGVGNNPTGANLGSAASTSILTSGSVYTMMMEVMLTAAGTEVVSNLLYSGYGTAGSVLGSVNVTVLSSGTNFVSSFDALAIGIRNAGTSQLPLMDISQVEVLTVPEPTSAVLYGFGALALALSYRRIRR